jgi:two-component system chemotaxis response regulator CheB
LHQKVASVCNLNLQGLQNRTAANLQETGSKVQKSISLPRGGRQKHEVVAIGSSTGGPPALQKILSQLPVELPFAVLVSQHMPTGFTKTFADRLNRLLPFEVSEAVEGDIVRKNRVLIAPGGMNMTVAAVRDQVVVRLKAPAKEDKYIPSVNAMLASVARVYSSRALAVILTGMGNDGSQGVKKIKEAGGASLAEAEESAVVFGMPREAISTGAVDSVVHLDIMAKNILEFCGFKTGRE